MTIEELARRVLAMLDAQKRYFASRSSADLEASKALERALRRECQDLLRGPTLFPEG